jgi:hypothetical protein
MTGSFSGLYASLQRLDQAEVRALIQSWSSLPSPGEHVSSQIPPSWRASIIREDGQFRSLPQAGGANIQSRCTLVLSLRSTSKGESRTSSVSYKSLPNLLLHVELSFLNLHFRPCGDIQCYVVERSQYTPASDIRCFPGPLPSSFPTHQ